MIRKVQFWSQSSGAHINSIRNSDFVTSYTISRCLFALLLVLQLLVQRVRGNYGVTCSFWDHIFGTNIAPATRRSVTAVGEAHFAQGQTRGLRTERRNDDGFARRRLLHGFWKSRHAARGSGASDPSRIGRSFSCRGTSRRRVQRSRTLAAVRASGRAACSWPAAASVPRGRYRRPVGDWKRDTAAWHACRH